MRRCPPEVVLCLLVVSAEAVLLLAEVPRYPPPEWFVVCVLVLPLAERFVVLVHALLVEWFVVCVLALPLAERFVECARVLLPAVRLAVCVLILLLPPGVRLAAEWSVVSDLLRDGSGDFFAPVLCLELSVM